ncbi:hypothetical protein ACTXJK_15225 [Brachybacterium tyrofermentans]|uniref:hypothetical protein n=1 Tax=Brachybacterium tyrofermentans TaxID=47848 RepID=UPI003FD64A8A
MLTTPSPDTRTAAKVLQSVLDPRPPAFADLRYAHLVLTEDPTAGIDAFHYWAAGIDPSEPDAPVRLARDLLTAPSRARAEHVYQVCRALADYSATAAVDVPRASLDAVRVTYLLWAAAMTPDGPAHALALCAEAGDIDVLRVASHPVFALAVRRMGTGINDQEVQG